MNDQMVFLTRRESVVGDDSRVILLPVARPLVSLKLPLILKVFSYSLLRIHYGLLN